tara:strand:- start:651 stop:899 length:249 start_codon:yes stop_codon:yes gene_type:complete
MADNFGPPIFNETLPSIQDIAHIYTADEVALLLGALSAAVAGIIYSVKNVKSSSCCGGLIKCQQRTEIPPSKNSIIMESSNV